MRSRRFIVPLLLSMAVALGAQTATTGGVASIQPEPLKEWLGYIASDDLQGRQVFTEGLGLAAAYISDHLKEWDVKPGGDHGTYFQTVKVLGVNSESHASVTVEVNGQARTFTDGAGVTFAKNMGGKHTVSGDDLQFAGYGLQLPEAKIDDYAHLDPRGKIVIWLGSNGPESVGAVSRRILAARSRVAIEKGAIAVFAPESGSTFRRGGSRSSSSSEGAVRGQGGAAQPGRAGQAPAADFTTVQRYEDPVPPTVTAGDNFFEFLFSGSGTSYATLKEAAAKGEPLPPFALRNTKVTINVDADYEVVDDDK